MTEIRVQKSEISKNNPLASMLLAFFALCSSLYAYPLTRSSRPKSLG
jgi:hypothetical protein